MRQAERHAVLKATIICISYGAPCNMCILESNLFQWNWNYKSGGAVVILLCLGLGLGELHRNYLINELRMR